MDNEQDEQYSEADALLQLVEVINAKGDAGEIEQIVNRKSPDQQK